MPIERHFAKTFQAACHREKLNRTGSSEKTFKLGEIKPTFAFRAGDIGVPWFTARALVGLVGACTVAIARCGKDK